MDSAVAIDLARYALVMTIKLALPILMTGLIVALVVSILQAATQIQDQTLTLVPKILAMMLAGLITGPWIVQLLVEFGREMFSRLP